MNQDKIEKLTNYLAREERIGPAVAACWASRIINDYPDDLKHSFNNYYQTGKKTNVTIEFFNEQKMVALSLKTICKLCKCDYLQGLEIVYIYRNLGISHGHDILNLLIKK